MISDDDITKLKTVFATKDDRKNYLTKDDLKRELKPIRLTLEKMNRSLETVIHNFARHHQTGTAIESH